MNRTCVDSQFTPHPTAEITLPRSSASLFLSNCVIIFIFLSTVIVGHAQDTRITGKLKLFAFPADTNSTPFRTVDFTVTRGTANWEVSLTNFVYREGDGPLAIRYFSDGTNSTSVTYWPRANSDREKGGDASPNPFAGDVSQRAIEKIQGTQDHFPFDREFIEIAPWIEFCLPTYLKPGETNLIPNLFMDLAWPTNRIPCVADDTDTSEYPAHVTMWKPGIALRNNAKHEIQSVALPKPYNQGYEGLKLDVTSWRESGRMPQQFIETIYSVIPPPIGRDFNDPRPIISVIVIGDVDDIKELKGEVKTVPFRRKDY